MTPSEPPAPAAETQRLFIAGELPGETIAAIAAWQESALAAHADELRLNHALHLTLAFLGDVAAAEGEQLAADLAAIRWPPCRLRLAAPLFLPQRGAKRVVALSVDDLDGRLADLHRQVGALLVARGLRNQSPRAWRAHVTVARYRHPSQPFSLQNVNIPELSVVRMGLYSSVLERTGAVHTPLATYPAS